MSSIQLGSTINGNSSIGSSLGTELSFSADGLRLAVGNKDHSKVLIYDFVAGNWSLNTTLTQSDAFGCAVALSNDGNRLAVGCQGSANVYIYDYSSSVWSLTTTLFAASSPSAEVQMTGDGSIIAIGAFTFSNRSGAIDVYKLSNGTWSPYGQRLVGPANSFYGVINTVSISDNGLLLAAGGFLNQVDLYAYNNGAWTLAASKSGSSGDSAGTCSLSADGTTLAIGASNYNSGQGKVTVYNYSNGNLTQIGGDIVGNYEYFGTSLMLAYNGSRLIVGAKGDNNSSSYSNSYVFDGTSWNLITGGTISSSDTNQYVGYAVAVSRNGKKFATSAIRANDFYGYVKVYEYSGSSIAYSPGSPPVGAGGDPYVTTVEGCRYKLPAVNAPIRFYQGEVDGKLLTINAQLRTIENEELAVENFKSYLELKSKIPVGARKKMATSVFEKSILTFFEKFYINYDGVELGLDVWDGKFKVDFYKGGKIIAKSAETAGLLKKCTDIYDDYSGQTLKFSIGRSAYVYISVYNTKIIRNGIYLDINEDIGKGNGVVVNTLSTKDMTLASLKSVDPVPRRNTAPEEKTEIFMDKSGYRVKTIHLAH
jgi:WD40 repeat protein